MECPKCMTQFNSTSQIPLLLPQCGHSLCQNCISQIFSNNSIQCALCQKITNNISDISVLPKNLALLQVQKNQIVTPIENNNIAQGGKNDVVELCQIHNKKLEAFCMTDNSLLCIDCILLDGHKSHEIATIGDAAEKMRNLFTNQLSENQKTGLFLKSTLQNIDKHKEKLVEIHNERISKISAIFSEIIANIQNYENGLKNTVTLHLETEQEKYNKIVNSIKNRLEAIQNFTENLDNFKSETDCELLQKVAERKEKHKISMKETPNPTFSILFADYTKDQELTNLWKILQSEKLNTLHSNSSTSAIPILPQNIASRTKKANSVIKMSSRQSTQSRVRSNFDQTNKQNNMSHAESSGKLSPQKIPQRLGHAFKSKAREKPSLNPNPSKTLMSSPASVKHQRFYSRGSHVPIKSPQKDLNELYFFYQFKN